MFIIYGEGSWKIGGGGGGFRKEASKRKVAITPHDDGDDNDDNYGDDDDDVLDDDDDCLEYSISQEEPCPLYNNTCQPHKIRNRDCPPPPPPPTQPSPGAMSYHQN